MAALIENVPPIRSEYGVLWAQCPPAPGLPPYTVVENAGLTGLTVWGSKPLGPCPADSRKI